MIIALMCGYSHLQLTDSSIVLLSWRNLDQISGMVKVWVLVVVLVVVLVLVQAWELELVQVLVQAWELELVQA